MVALNCVHDETKPNGATHCTQKNCTNMSAQKTMEFMLSNLLEEDQFFSLFFQRF